MSILALSTSILPTANLERDHTLPNPTTTTVANTASSAQTAFREAIASQRQSLNEIRDGLENTLSILRQPVEPVSDQIVSNHNQSCCDSKWWVLPTIIPGVGTGITIAQELRIAKKLKNETDPNEIALLLAKQKNFRISALVRTFQTVALAVTILAISIITGGLGVGLGLGLIVAALGVGIGFSTLYSTLLHSTQQKINPPEVAEEPMLQI